MPIRNLRVKMVVAYQNFGSVTSTTTVEMTRMNLLTSADRGIVQTDGRDVPAVPTTDAYQNGSSAMEKTIVATIAMKSRRTVQNVRTQTSGVATTVAYPSRNFYPLKPIAFYKPFPLFGSHVSLCSASGDGCVTTKMTVLTTLMRPTPCAKACTETVRRANSDVTMANVYHTDGGVTMTTIAATIQMSLDVLISSARYP